MAAAEAALESRSNFVTGLNYIHVPDTAICSHHPICNRHGLMHDTCYKHYKLSGRYRLEAHRTFKADRFVLQMMQH